MRIFPPSHYTMGGLWVDYNLMSTLPGLHVIGEANFSDHGANRLGASALMQGLGRRLLRHPLHDRELPRLDQARKIAVDHPEVKGREARGRGCGTGRCSTSTGSARRLRSTASSGRSCGSTAAWPGTSEGSPWRSPRSRAPRGILEGRQGLGRRGRAEPVPRARRARRRFPRAGRADVPRRARRDASRAAATSARSTRRKTARRFATIWPSATSRRGSIAVPARVRSATSSRSRSKTSTSRPGATK